MKVGVVGGIDRSEQALARAARVFGDELELHSGYMRAGSQGELAALLDRVDFAIVVTDVNSHGAVQLTRKLARRRGVPVVLVRRLGVARLVEILAERAPLHGGRPRALAG